MSEEELSQDQDANTAEENVGVAGPEIVDFEQNGLCLLYTSPSPRD